jgi:hypothetical protein
MGDRSDTNAAGRGERQTGSPDIGDAGRLWRDRAEAARKQAAQFGDAEAKRQALEIAASYDRLARYLEEQAAKKHRP